MKTQTVKRNILIIYFLVNLVNLNASDIHTFYPENNEARYPTEQGVVLAWLDIPEQSGVSVVYDIYFGTDETPPLYKSDVSDGWTDSTGFAFIDNYNTDTTLTYYFEAINQITYSTQYYWKVVAKMSDGSRDSSDVYTFKTTRENTAPSAPEIIYPENLATDIPSENLTLKWSKSIDQENDSVYYKLYFGTSNSPALIADSLTTNSFTIPYQLGDFTGYHWKVDAFDSYDGTTVSSSAKASFRVENYFNDPPTAPVALSPDSVINIGKSVVFQWAASTDKDGDLVKYNLYVDDNPNPTTLIAEGITTLSHFYRIEEAYNKKYWKVVATDGVNYTESQVLSYIPYEKPKAPVTLLGDSLINTGKQMKFQWTSSCPNPDEIIYYDLYLDNNPNPKTLVAPGIRETNFITTVKEPYSTYYWKIVTRDTAGILFESSIKSFTPWKNQNTSVSIEMVDVDGGEFSMGNPEYTMLVPGFESWGKLFVENMTPQRSVFLDDFSMAKYEITYSQYLPFLNAIKDSWYIDVENNKIMYRTGELSLTDTTLVETDGVLLCYVKSDTATFDFKIHSKLTWDGTQLYIKPGFEQYPVNWISSRGIKLFLDWVDKRLPTEAEWEYAARGGNKSQNYMYGGSNNAAAAGWFLFGDVNYDNPMTGDNYGDPSKNYKGTNKVGLKAANELGIYDISGNLREMCSDYYEAKQYLYTEYYNPQGPIEGTSLVGRGGSYTCLASEIMTRARSLASLGITGIRAAGNHSASETVLVHGIIRDEFGSALEGVNMLCGDKTDISTKSGRFQFRINMGDTIRIVPSHPDYTFSPSEIILESTDDVTTQNNFTAYLKREVRISGTITRASNALPVRNVLLKGFPGEIYTDANGKYFIDVPKNREYNVKIKERGFIPVEVQYTVQETELKKDITLDYVGYYTLSGKVTDQTTGGPEPNVYIGGLDNDYTYTLADGIYFTQLTRGWSGTIKAYRKTAHSSYTPAEVVIDSFPGNMEVNFQEISLSRSAFYSGKIVDVFGNPVEGIEIQGFDNKKATTDRYGIFGLEMPTKWEGTITPVSEVYTFSPSTHDAYVALSYEDPPPSSPYFVAIPPGAYTISGTITDENGTPMQGVRLVGFNTEIRTDLNGRYSVWVDSASNYIIQPRLSGYTFTPDKLEAKKINSNIIQNFDASIYSSTVYSVVFKVADGSQNIENATIIFDETTYITDANGEVIVTGIQPGDYSFIVSATGFDDVSGSLTVSNTDVTENITMNLTPIITYQVTFNVSDGLQAIENASVSFNGGSYTTDSNGEVNITGLQPGTYTYSISATGFVDVTGTITVSNTDVIENITMSLIPAITYKVTFNVSDGLQVIENASVSFNGGSYTTDSNGEVSLTGLQPGTYTYSISATGFVDVRGTVTVSNNDVTENVIMSTIPINTYQVTFNVDDGLQAIENASVSFNGVSYTTDSNGEVNITGLQSGTYTYSISATGFVDVTGSVTVSNNDVTENVTMNTTPIITYQVRFNVDDGLQAIENANVSFNGETYTTNANGEVSITGLQSGTYSYTISAAGFVDVSGSVDVSNTDVTENVTMNTTPIITYQVTFNVSDGLNVIENASIDFNSSTYTSDANGLALADNVDAGIYNYSVSAIGFKDTSGTISVTDTDLTEMVILKLVTGIKEEYVKSIRCYPNPTYGAITININGYKFTEGEIKIINQLGQLVKDIPLISGVNSYTWQGENTSSDIMSEGIFFVQIYIDCELIDTQKLVILKK